MAQPISSKDPAARQAAAVATAGIAAHVGTPPKCSHCGFEMTPLRLARGLALAALDDVFECRPCGVMQIPEAILAPGPTSTPR